MVSVFNSSPEVLQYLQTTCRLVLHAPLQLHKNVTDPALSSFRIEKAANAFLLGSSIFCSDLDEKLYFGNFKTKTFQTTIGKKIPNGLNVLTVKYCNHKILVNKIICSASETNH